MSATTPEGRVKKKLTDILKAHKIWYFFPGNNGFGKSGIPDVICILGGLFVGVECKADATKKPTALQLQQGQKIRDSGGYWFLVCDDLTLQQFEQFVAKHK